MTPTINFILSVLTFLAQVFLAGLLLLAMLSIENLKKNSAKFLSEKNALWAVFFISLLATSGSLFYSQIAGFPPCELCWFQRIFMYPQVVILGVALLKKESQILDYSLALASVGTLISLYHNYIIYAAVESNTCLLSAISCTTKVVLGLGYVTIPLMALTAFVAILAILLLQRLGNKK